MGSRRPKKLASSTAERLQALEAQVARLAARLEALEVKPPSSRVRPSTRKPGPVDFALLEKLQSLRGKRYERGESGGAVTYAGSARFGERHYLWTREHPLPEILRRGAEPMARALSSLGNPLRLSLLQALLSGPRSSQELQEALGLGSAGQFYHHLKDLLASGLIVQTERSRYELPAHRIVPLLAVLSAGFDLLGEAPGPMEAPPEGQDPPSQEST